MLPAGTIYDGVGGWTTAVFGAFDMFVLSVLFSSCSPVSLPFMFQVIYGQYVACCLVRGPVSRWWLVLV